VRPGGSWIALKALPLCIPLAGLLKNRMYTYRWLSLLIWLYFTGGVVRGRGDKPPSPVLARAEGRRCPAHVEALQLPAGGAQGPQAGDVLCLLDRVVVVVGGLVLDRQVRRPGLRRCVDFNAHALTIESLGSVWTKNCRATSSDRRQPASSRRSQRASTRAWPSTGSHSSSRLMPTP